MESTVQNGQQAKRAQRSTVSAIVPAEMWHQQLYMLLLSIQVYGSLLIIIIIIIIIIITEYKNPNPD